MKRFVFDWLGRRVVVEADDWETPSSMVEVEGGVGDLLAWLATELGPHGHPAVSRTDPPTVRPADLAFVLRRHKAGDLVSGPEGRLRPPGPGRSY